jgi:hypothetical protein
MVETSVFQEKKTGAPGSFRGFDPPRPCPGVLFFAGAAVRANGMFPLSLPNPESAFAPLFIISEEEAEEP